MKISGTSVLVGVISIIFCAAISPAQQGNTITITKPAQPSSTVVLTDTYNIYSSDRGTNIYTQAKPWLAKGYIIKSTTAAACEWRFQFVMVLEKY